MYLGLIHPTVFRKLGVLSPSAWWDNRFIVRRIRALRAKPASKIWVSTGIAEGEGMVQAARGVHVALEVKGWSLGVDLDYVKVEGRRTTRRRRRAWCDPSCDFSFPGVSPRRFTYRARALWSLHVPAFVLSRVLAA